MFRPFPRAELRAAATSAKRIGVLDRNHSPGSGGIFWQEVAAALGADHAMIQDYLVGLGGGDVTPATLHGIADDLTSRTHAAAPIWKEVAA
jgi:pyruvate/2-oxoacid:ferredoxin oxidoreductase alpha subunit